MESHFSCFGQSRTASAGTPDKRYFHALVRIRGSLGWGYIFRTIFVIFSLRASGSCPVTRLLSAFYTQSGQRNPLDVSFKVERWLIQANAVAVSTEPVSPLRSLAEPPFAWPRSQFHYWVFRPRFCHCRGSATISRKAPPDPHHTVVPAKEPANDRQRNPTRSGHTAQQSWDRRPARTQIADRPCRLTSCLVLES